MREDRKPKPSDFVLPPAVEQEICRLEGLVFPCQVNLFHSFFLVPIFALGFVIRGLRVVILSSSGQENKPLSLFLPFIKGSATKHSTPEFSRRQYPISEASTTTSSTNSHTFV